jgi:hypothetical protein
MLHKHKIDSVKSRIEGQVIAIAEGQARLERLNDELAQLEEQAERERVQRFFRTLQLERERLEAEQSSEPEWRDGLTTALKEAKEGETKGTVVLKNMITGLYFKRGHGFVAKTTEEASGFVSANCAEVAFVRATYEVTYIMPVER